MKNNQVTQLLAILFSVCMMSVGYLDSAVLASELDHSESSYLSEREKEVQEKTELPDVYANTVIYNGRTAPGSTIHYSLESNPEIFTEVPVSESGKFTVDFGSLELQEGDVVIFYNSGAGMPLEMAFEKTVQGATEGKEIIGLDDNTSQEEQNLAEMTSVPDIYPHTRIVRGSTADTAAVYYAIDGSSLHIENRTSTYLGKLAGEFISYFNDAELEAGQTVHFYIIANGVTVIVDKEVLATTAEQEQAIETIQAATHLPEYYVNTKNYYGKTVPHAKVVISNPYQSGFELTVEADENGDFSAEYQEEYFSKEGSTLLFTITDESGYTISLETPVLAAVDNPNYEEPVSPPNTETEENTEDDGTNNSQEDATSPEDSSISEQSNPQNEEGPDPSQEESTNNPDSPQEDSSASEEKSDAPPETTSSDASQQKDSESPSSSEQSSSDESADFEQQSSQNEEESSSVQESAASSNSQEASNASETSGTLDESPEEESDLPFSPVLIVLVMGAAIGAGFLYRS